MGKLTAIGSIFAMFTAFLRVPGELLLDKGANFCRAIAA
jgi:hypothetical protein